MVNSENDPVDWKGGSTGGALEVLDTKETGNGETQLQPLSCACWSLVAVLNKLAETRI